MIISRLHGSDIVRESRKDRLAISFQRKKGQKMTSDCESTSIIIFGASGDLTWRKLVPALYNNFKKSRLSTSTHVIGFARRPYSSETFRDYLRNGVEKFSPESFE